MKSLSLLILFLYSLNYIIQAATKKNSTTQKLQHNTNTKQEKNEEEFN